LPETGPGGAQGGPIEHIIRERNRFPMRTLSAAVVLTAAGVALTGGAAHADTTPAPTGEAWSTTEVTEATPARPWSSTTVTEQPAPSPDAPDAAADGLADMRKAPVRVPTRPRPRPVSRTGTRRATGAGCRPLHDGVWTVRPGDTTWLISFCTHHSVGDLVGANRLPDGGRLIFPGDRIAVR
jgi:nucleoid-associated protein YgaU